MQTYASSARFSDWSTNQTDKDHAGYINPATNEYWITTTVFKHEICGDYDPAKVCEVLHKRGWLKRNETRGRWQFQKKGKGWFYVLQGESPPCDEEE